MGKSTARTAPEAALADVLADILMAGGVTFASFEGALLAEGNAIMARAAERALKRLDAALLPRRPFACVPTTCETARSRPLWATCLSAGGVYESAEASSC